MPARVPPFFVLSSNVAMTNTRAAGFVLTLLHQSISLPCVHWLGSAEGARKGPLTLWHKGDAGGPFRPSGSGRGHHSGRGRPPCGFWDVRKAERNHPLSGTKETSLPLSTP